jgi:formylglycine-generating enzyme required for sulfatase activity
VSTDYSIGETEVTYELWNKVHTWATAGDGVPVHTGEAQYTFANNGTMGDTGAGPDTNQHPVTTLNWRDAMIWTNALTEYYNAQNGTSYAVVYTTNAAFTSPKRDSRDVTCGAASVGATAGDCDNPFINPNAKGFRLPTSLEWELAARFIADNNPANGDIKDVGEFYQGDHISGDTSAPFGSSGILGNYAWYSSNSGTSTNAVATKTSNALGLHDMSGNVYEWVHDWDAITTNNRILRGGAFSTVASALQVGDVICDFPYKEYSNTGFRPVRTP